MKNSVLENLYKHFQENFWLYCVSILCICIGVVLGVYSVKYMGQYNKNNLISYFTGFTETYHSGVINNKDVFFETLKNNLPIIFVIWFLGLTMIGIPIILVIDILKGFTVGFTSSFLISAVGIKGIWFTIIGVIPQNIIYLPCITFLSVLAMEFSIALFRNNAYRNWASNVFSRIASYTFVFLCTSFIMLGGFVVESFVTPSILKIVIK